MNDEEYNPFWHSGAAALLLGGIIVAMYMFLLQPAMEKSCVLQARVECVELRISNKQKQLQNTEQKSVELERGDPETIRETIRQELLKGKRGEFLF